MNVIFLDDEGIRDVNLKYRGRNRATNVISFAMRDGEFGNLNPGILGDILISIESARRDAEASSLSLEDMLDYLMIHGVLHLLGHDHEQSSHAASAMKKLEEEIFALLHDYPIDALSTK